MHHISDMIKKHPAGGSVNADVLSSCVNECFSCAQSCQLCADACLSENSVNELTRCISLNAACADLCLATGNMLLRLKGSEAQLQAQQLRSCIRACEVCEAQCREHQQHEHCGMCAASCQSCKQACQKMLSELKVGV